MTMVPMRAKLSRKAAAKTGRNETSICMRRLLLAGRERTASVTRR